MTRYMKSGLATLAVALACVATQPVLAQTAAAAANHKAIERPIQDELIYFVMPDRFANGDPGNDRGGIAGDADHNGFDPSRKGFFHGGDLKGLRERPDYLQGMGLPPIWVRSDAERGGKEVL